MEYQPFPADPTVIEDLNPVLRGWGNYERLRDLRIQRKGRHLRAGEASAWSREKVIFWRM